MNHSINIEQIIAVAKKLQHLKDEVVFVGGSTTELLVDEVARGQARQTEDVDFVVDIEFNLEYSKFEKKMRDLDFVNDTSKGAPICRWLMDFHGKKLKVDSMSSHGTALGFTNCWYQSSIKTAWEKEIEQGLFIKVIEPVHFLGTKFEAFKGRGNGDIFSHDLEDIFFVLEHNGDIERKVYDSNNSKLKSYLAEQFKNLLLHPDLINTLPGLLDDDASVPVVIGKIKFFSTL